MGNLRHGCAIAFVHESSWEKDFHQRDMDLIGVTHTDTVLESQKEEYCHSRAPWSPPPFGSVPSIFNLTCYILEVCLFSLPPLE